MASNVFGKKILLYMPKFHGYEQIIKQELENKGAFIHFIENKKQKLDPNIVSGNFLLLKRLFYAFHNLINKYINEQVLPAINGQSYDFLFTINCYAVNQKLIYELRKSNPEIKCIIYVWDSMSMFNWVKIIKLYDKIFSFDSYDCKTHKWTYLPNFFIQNNLLNIESNIDLFFVGTQTFDRYTFLSKIITQLEKNQTHFFVKLLICHKNSLHNRYLYKLIKIIPLKSKWIVNYIINYELYEKILKIDFLIYKPINPSALSELIMQANTILDITPPLQTGYSHRVIYALANGKKLITTNNSIQNESSYTDKQIKIIDRQHSYLDFDWIKQQEPFETAYFAQYRIDNWLETIFN